ncbi:MAG: nucleotidyltransferase family protein [Kordiimonas sp.]
MSVGQSVMIMAAGKGTRMGTLSDRLPKPLTKVNGKSLLDRLLEHIDKVSATRTVVNVHHLPDQIENALKDRVETGAVLISDERDELLETGGGVKKALPKLGPDPFFVLNGDALWVDGKQSNLARLKEAWNPAVMDVLLLLIPKAEALGYEGVGDFFADDCDCACPLKFRDEAATAPYVFGGVLLINPHLYEGTPEGSWSNRVVFRKAASTGRLYGLVIDGHWMHVGTPEAIAAAEDKLAMIGAM